MQTTAVQIPGYLAGTWTIDPAHSEVSFVIRHLMIAKIRGRFTRFEGEIVLAGDPLDSRVTATIDMDSVDSANAQRDAHLRSADFFEVTTYPEMTYRSGAIRPDGDGFIMDGELTLKGVTRPVPLRLEVNGFGPDPFRDDPAGARAGFTASGEINRSDFKVDFAGPIPGAGTLLGEKVQIVLEVEAFLQTG